MNSRLTSNLQCRDIERESSGAYLMKLEENLSYGFEVTLIFFKNAV